MNEKYFRKCPLCEKQLSYSNKKNRNYAENHNKVCLSCSLKQTHKRPDVILKNKIRAKLLSKKYIGIGNPFYGKKHTVETREKISKIDRSYTKTDDFKRKSIRRGKDNGMYGKNFYDVWVDKYGEEEANNKMRILRQKKSLQSSGKNNPMYGKPAPHGSGNGWSGWYKGWFFRSLKELSYMIKVIEKKGYRWRTAETNDLAIKYIGYDGTERTYRADFLINEIILVEVKPKKLMNAPTNRRKREAAIMFCKKNNLEYRMIDVKMLTDSDIMQLFLNKNLVFTEKYKQKMEERINDLVAIN